MAWARWSNQRKIERLLKKKKYPFLVLGIFPKELKQDPMSFVCCGFVCGCLEAQVSTKDKIWNMESHTYLLVLNVKAMLLPPVTWLELKDTGLVSISIACILQI